MENANAADDSDADARIELHRTGALRALGIDTRRAVSLNGLPLERLWRGVWAPSGQEDMDRRIAVLHAVAAKAKGDVVFSHHSAALLWNLPLINAGAAIQQTVGRDGGGSSRKVVRHRFDLAGGDVARLPSGVQVTSPARTIVDLACNGELVDAVAAADHALATGLVASDDLESALTRIVGRKGIRNARLAIQLADPRSDSAGESLSRVQMYAYGLARPILQQDFGDYRGDIGRVDFWWPGVRVIGEFDGMVKYGAELNDSVGDGFARVRAEKLREDRLRRPGNTVVRWTWADARGGKAMADLLLAAGVPRCPRSDWLTSDTK